MKTKKRSFREQPLSDSPERRAVVEEILNSNYCSVCGSGHKLGLYFKNSADSLDFKYMERKRKFNIEEFKKLCFEKKEVLCLTCVSKKSREHYQENPIKHTDNIVGYRQIEIPDGRILDIPIYLHTKRGKDLIIEQAKEDGCFLCHSYDELEFHHKDPKTKKFDIAMKTLVSGAQLKEELAKCICLCHNCHVDVHDGKKELNIDSDKED